MAANWLKMGVKGGGANRIAVRRFQRFHLSSSRIPRQQSHKFVIAHINGDFQGNKETIHAKGSKYMKLSQASLKQLKLLYL